ERGPLFIHADPCDGYPTPHRYPPGLSARQQVVRAYDHDGRIADGVLVADGDHGVADQHAHGACASPLPPGCSTAPAMPQDRFVIITLLEPDPSSHEHNHE